MNVNQIINMAMRILMRKAIGSGINAASELGRKPRPNADTDAPQPVSDTRQPKVRGAPRQAKQIARITRRLTRF